MLEDVRAMVPRRDERAPFRRAFCRATLRWLRECCRGALLSAASPTSMRRAEAATMTDAEPDSSARPGGSLMRRME